MAIKTYTGGGTDQGPIAGHHYFAGGTFEEQQQQMAPLQSLLTSGKYRDIPGGILDNYMRGSMSLENATAAITKTPVFDASKGPQIDFGYGKTQLPKGQYDLSLLDFSPKGTDQGMTKDSLRKVLASPLSTKGSEVPLSSGSKLSSDLLGSAGSAPSASSAPPTPPSLQANELNLNAQYGVDAANDTYNKAVSDLNAFKDQIAQEKLKIGGEPVSSRVQGRMLTNLSRKNQATLLALTSAVRSASTVINSRNKVVASMMKYEGMDYNNSLRVYQDQFNNYMRLSSALDRESSTEQRISNANWSAGMNLIKSHPEMFKNPTPDEKNWLDELDMNAGKPIGTLQSYSASSPTLTHYQTFTDKNTGEKYEFGLDVNGKPHITGSIGNVGVSSAQGSSDKEKTLLDALHKVAGVDGYVSPDDYLAAKRSWVKNTKKTGAAFDAKMSIYRNPKNQDYQVDKTVVGGINIVP